MLNHRWTLSKHMKQYYTTTLFTLLCCKKVFQRYKNSKVAVHNKIISIKSALSSDKAHFQTCTPYGPEGGRRSSFSHVSAQRRVELRETLNQLLELGPLLRVQGPAASHHCKPATHQEGTISGPSCVCGVQDKGCMRGERRKETKTRRPGVRLGALLLHFHQLSLFFAYRRRL